MLSEYNLILAEIIYTIILYSSILFVYVSVQILWLYISTNGWKNLFHKLE